MLWDHKLYIKFALAHLFLSADPCKYAFSLSYISGGVYVYIYIYMYISLSLSACKHVEPCVYKSSFLFIELNKVKFVWAKALDLPSAILKRSGIVVTTFKFYAKQ